MKCRVLAAAACAAAVVWFAGAVPTLAVEANGSGSLTLLEAVEGALGSHPSVESMRAREEAARAAVNRATSSRWPQLSAGGTLTSLQEPNLVKPLHSFDVSQIEFESSILRTDLTLVYALYDGGARGAHIRRARADAAGVSSTREMEEMSLAARVVHAYLNVLTANGVLDAAGRHAEALRAERSRVERTLAEGRGARVEMLRVEALLSEVEGERQAAAARLEAAERELALLAGVSAAEAGADRLEDVRAVRSESIADADALIARARDNNPAVAAARRGVESAQAGERVAIAAWIPRFDAVGSYLGYGSLDSDFTLEWQVGVSVSYPLFTGGARSGASKEASARTRAAREDLRSSELSAEESVNRALSAVIETNALADAAERALAHQEEVVRIEALSRDVGTGTQTDYLEAEAQLFRVRSRLVESRNAEIAARVELARILGDLTPEWLSQHLETTP